ncbi:interleukin-12 subunit alpha-like [Silurus meridionalis]|nr:interleukin-12 subunit alpha-like [Silurus meridionalis]
MHGDLDFKFYSCLRGNDAGKKKKQAAKEKSTAVKMLLRNAQACYTLHLRNRKWFFWRTCMNHRRPEARLLLSLLYTACTAGPTGARSVPVHLSKDACQGPGRALLRNVTDALDIDQLFRGLNCTEQSAELPVSSRTLSACTPQADCLQSVLEDLRYYWATFKSYRDTDRILEQSVLRSIENLVQSCFSVTLMDDVQVSLDNKNSFERRLKLCKILKGFQVRTITINRVLNHIVSSLQT